MFINFIINKINTYFLDIVNIILPGNYEFPEVSTALHTRYPTPVLQEAERINKEFDLRFFSHLPEVNGITIDPGTSRDLDDGLVVCKKLPDNKGYHAQVAISGVTEIVPEWSLVEREFIDRSMSIYLKDADPHHAIPNVISTGIASLNHHQHTPVMNVELDFDSDFHVRRTDFYPAIFFNRNRMDYDSFERSSLDTSAPDYEMLAIAHEMARGLRKRREEKVVSQWFNDIEKRILLWERVEWIRNTHVSQLIIQEFMIAVNRQMSEVMNQSGVPMMYREHMQEYEWIKSLPKVGSNASYSADPGFHTWLWVPIYGQWTSPIRRLADFLNMRQAFAVAKDQALPYDRKFFIAWSTYHNLQWEALRDLHREEEMNQRGVEVVDNCDIAWGEFQPIRQHVRHRVNHNLRISKPVKKAIIEDIRTTNSIDRWVAIILRENPDLEILQEIKKIVMEDTKTSRYIGILWSHPGIRYTESLKIIWKRVVHFIDFSVNWKRSRTYYPVIQDINNIPTNEFTGFDISVWRKTFTINKRKLSQAKYKARKQALRKTFETLKTTAC